MIPPEAIKQFITIHIEWHGPYLIEDVLKKDIPIFSKIGLYQIYGDHPINGSDNLLYIGQTAISFKARFKEHNQIWIKHECTNNQIYLGVIWNYQKMDLNCQLLFIKESEKLLTYYCSPPYNSTLVYDMNQSSELKNENVMVINLWQKHRLPYEVSTLWYYSECWKSKRELLKSEKRF
jgi:hypothetical protein